jgi:hypothetical protein
MCWGLGVGFLSTLEAWWIFQDKCLQLCEGECCCVGPQTQQLLYVAP